MRIVQQKIKHRYKVGVAVVMLFSLLTLNRTYLTEEFFLVLDRSMVYDLGFSDPRALGQTAPEIIEQIIAKAPEMISGSLFGFPNRPEMERLDVIIKFIDYKKIISDQQRAIFQAILTDPTEVKAKIVFRGKAYKAELRLKGDLRDHWRSSMRMSFRISLKTKGTIKSFRRFSIHKPKARLFPFDQVYQGLIKRMGGLSTTHDYVHLFVNGEDWGVMNMEEHMSKELLEKQHRKESLIFKLGDDQKWAYTDKHGLRNVEVAAGDKPYHQGYMLSDPRLYISAYKSKKYLRDQKFREYYSYVIENMYRGTDLYDVDSFSKNYLMAKIWNYPHTLFFTNSRYYLNPYTLMLEPISMDQGRFNAINPDDIDSLSSYFSDISTYYPNISSRKEFKGNFNKNFSAAISAAKQIEDVYGEIRNYFPTNRPLKTSIFHENIRLLEKLYNQDQNIGPDAISIPDVEIEIPDNRHARQIPSHTFVQHYVDGKIRIHNLLPVPLKVIGIYSGQKRLAADLLEIPSYQEQPYVEISTEVVGVNDGKVLVSTELLGEQRTSRNSFSLVANLSSPFIEALSGDAQKFITLKNGKYHFSAGEWHVSSPIVLEGPVIIPAGTRLLFANDAYLMIKGSLRANGSAEEKIIFAPETGNQQWGGIYVRLADERSLLNHVSITGTNEFEAGILKLTGGITFYKSDVTIENSVFSANKSEDALNIIESDFLISGSLFDLAPSDALDSDFSTGSVASSVFSNIEGDALDFSGGVVTMTALQIKNIKDKAISGGEGSHLAITDSLIEDADIAIASKDGSDVKASNVKIIRPTSYALMAYVKKSFWGVPSLAASNMKMNADSRYLRQNGATLTIDGLNIAEESLDVKALYQE